MNERRTRRERGGERDGIGLDETSSGGVGARERETCTAVGGRVERSWHDEDGRKEDG